MLRFNISRVGVVYISIVFTDSEVIYSTPSVDVDKTAGDRERVDEATEVSGR